LFHQAPLLYCMVKCFQPDPPFGLSARACSSTTSIVSIQQVCCPKLFWISHKIVPVYTGPNFHFILHYFSSRVFSHPFFLYSYDVSTRRFPFTLYFGSVLPRVFSLSSTLLYLFWQCTAKGTFPVINLTLFILAVYCQGHFSCYQLYPFSNTSSFLAHTLHIIHYYHDTFHESHTFNTFSSKSGNSSRIASFTKSLIFCSSTSSLKPFSASAHSMLAFISFTDKVW